ncbi:VIT1/CCC1 transporter family protein [Stakelama tenebrarum]|uniref:VIT family protein n=1 Tax=Stakelama tenebrarum TaxID=2711215 RepID=A0A6G6Y934_9SPHN|nr:VIT family protein [Sphingosinithalassobacter tenebrarum]QIG81429.1 VIT family protein [Sphingosinithalassobacter tenebrarum]
MPGRGTFHPEVHLVHRIGWLRAAVLGANDGIVSTASLIVGVAAATPDRYTVMIAGVSALLAGALSMAAGEYVSVSSQADTEHADLEREKRELRDAPEYEHAELSHIYEARGLEPELADKVATQLMAKDALHAHARDELGINDTTVARPVQAALTSAATFTIGAAAPLLVALLVPVSVIVPAVFVAALLYLGILGAVGAKTGGAPLPRAVLRVTFWGALAMLVTAGIGSLFGTAGA